MPASKSHTERKRIILISRLSILVFILTSVYIFLDWLLEIHVQSFIYVGFFTASVLTFFLNRAGKTEAAKAIGLLVFNVLIFIVASSESFATGIHLHLFAAGAVALTIYDFKDWPKSLFFATLSTVLYVLVYLGGFGIIDERHFSPSQDRLFFVINAAVNATICIYSFLLFSKLNYQAEKNLRENETIMLDQNEQLLKANRELDRFVYSVSHDLRAPLSSISGLIQLIEKSNNSGDVIQYLDLMKGRIQRLDQFIHDIINFSRNERSPRQLEEINITNLIQETFEALKNIPGADAIQLENNLHPGMTITVDRMRLEMILSNLISNAIQYRDVRKESSFIKFSFQPGTDGIVIFIDDNGIGINPSHQPNVFNMFYRATENSKGSGLGLYIVKEAVEKMGGTIALNSVEGAGTRFTLVLPVESQESFTAQDKEVMSNR